VKLRSAALVFLLAAALPDTAAAQEADAEQTKTANAKLHFERGREHYESGEFRKAANEFELSYDLSGKAALLYNIGRCYEALGEKEKAISYYRKYLSESPDAADWDEVNAHVEEMEDDLEEKEPAKKSDPGSEEKEDTTAAAGVEGEFEIGKRPEGYPQHIFDVRMGFLAELTSALSNAFVFDTNYFVALGNGWDFIPGLRITSFGRHNGADWTGYGLNLGIRKQWILSELMNIDARFVVSTMYLNDKRDDDGILLAGRVSSRLGFRVHDNVVVFPELGVISGPFFHDLDDLDVDFAAGIEALAGVEIWLYE